MPWDTPFSACSRALDGVSWVWGGLVANRSQPIRSAASYSISAVLEIVWPPLAALVGFAVVFLGVSLIRIRTTLAKVQ